MAFDYDVIVVGAGPGGYVAAIRCGQLGLKTAIIEADEVGGVCLNVGCIPSKAIISTGKQVAKARKGGRGINFGNVEVDMPAVITHKGKVVKQLTGGVAGLLKGNKVELIKGFGALVDAHTVKVGNQKFTSNHFILATGSSTLEIPPFPFDEKKIISSTGALELQAVPEKLVIIGAGVIGLELGGALANLGTKEITVVEMMDQILPGQDPDACKTLQRLMKKRGFTFHLGAKAQGAEIQGENVAVTFTDAKGADHTVVADHCLVSIGRRPNTKNIGLEQAGIKVDERGFVPTDDQGRTSRGNIFAIGDMTHGPMLAHKASKEGIVAAEAIAGQASTQDWKVVPGVIFTEPELASAGLTEAQAEAAGHKVRTGKFNVGALGKAVADGETDGFYKIVADADTDIVLGVHILAPHASDLISEAVLAIEMGATVEDIGLAMHPHPTLGEGMMEVAEAVHGKAIHSL